MNWKKLQNLKKTMVNIIQQLQKAQTTSEGSFASMKGWNTTWPSMLSTTPSLKTSKP